MKMGGSGTRKDQINELEGKVKGVGIIYSRTED